MQVDGDARDAGPGEGGGGEALSGRPRSLTEITKAEAQTERALQEARAGDIGLDARADEWLDGRVDGVIAEEVRGNPVRDPERPAEVGPVGLLDEQETPGDQRAG